MTIPEDEPQADSLIETKPQSETCPKPRIAPKVTVRQWLEAHRSYFLGWAYGLLNFGLFINYFSLNSGLVLGIIGIPGSLFIYHRYAKHQKSIPNRASAKYILILPGIFWFFAMLFYLIAQTYPHSHYEGLAVVYTIHVIIAGVLFLYSKLPQSVREWMEVRRMIFIGGGYILFHIFLSYSFIRSNLNYRAGLSMIPENLSAVALWVLGIPGSLLIGIFSAKSVKTNWKSARYLLLLPVIFGLVTFALYPDLYFRDLWIYFFVQLLVGAIVFYWVSSEGVNGADRPHRVVPKEGQS